MGSNNCLKNSMASLNSWYNAVQEKSNESNDQSRKREDEDFWSKAAQQMKYIDGSGSGGKVCNSDDSIKIYKAPVTVAFSSSFKKKRRLMKQEEIDSGRKISGTGETFDVDHLKPNKIEFDDFSSDASYSSQVDAYKDLASTSSVRSGNVKFQKQVSVGGISIRSQGSNITVLKLMERQNKASSWEESETKNRRRQSMLQQRQSLQPNFIQNRQEGPKNLLLVSNYDEYYERKDLRYFFQHPYARLFISYFVIFCNFLLFAEDPVSHSRTESDIAVVGNVFSFVLTKYPPQWTWSAVKVLMWTLAILCGMIFGKTVIHSCLCGRVLRLKMFRDEQGSWMTMFLTAIVSLYLFSHIYNVLLHFWYFDSSYIITSKMSVTNASVMKAAACGTWLGDLITALMVTDVMLQDNLYPKWAPRLREIWRRSNICRIFIFWGGSIVATSVVLTLIISDWISWDKLNHDFVATTELSRAFLASFILVMDLIIVMQDWDFPHFTTTLHVNLPGFRVATLKWQYADFTFSGKWFNYGIIFCVMICDLNMWKNQIFYNPFYYGQYTGIDDKIRTVSDKRILQTRNSSLWTWDARSHINETTGKPFYTEDMVMNSRYMGYPLSAKWTAFIPSVVGMILFITVISLYGRFPAFTQGERTINIARTDAKVEKEISDSSNQNN